MTTINFPVSYKNGDWRVTISSDGTLVKTSDVEYPKCDFPSSLDVKITNYCNLSKVCTFCHEKSDLKGQHCDVESLLGTLAVLPAGVELAIGGGDPLSHPQLVDLLFESKLKGHICNITVNQLHLSKNAKLLNNLISDNLICGLGISYRGRQPFFYNEPELQPIYEYKNAVFHFIAGVDDFYVINNFVKHPIGDRPFFLKKVLILGYKHFGNGVRYAKSDAHFLNSKIDKLAKHLPSLFDYAHISFDSLAVDQLKLRRLFTDSGWSKFYMGDDGSSSMYVDAVSQHFSKNSITPKHQRVSWKDKNLLEFFAAMQD